MTKSSVPSNGTPEVVSAAGNDNFDKSPDDKTSIEIKQNAILKAEELGDLAEPDEELRSPWPWARQARKPTDLDAIATQRSVFDDPALVQFYLPRSDHENLKRFDIAERWTYREERSVRRKTDWKIFLWILVMFFALNIDRGNLGNAVADNLLDE